MRCGKAPRSVAMRIKACTTSWPVKDWPASMARHSRVKLSTTVNARNRCPLNKASETKSMLQLWSGAVNEKILLPTAPPLRGITLGAWAPRRCQASIPAQPELLKVAWSHMGWHQNKSHDFVRYRNEALPSKDWY